MPCAMQVTTKPGAAAGDGAESVRLDNAMPVLPPMPHIQTEKQRPPPLESKVQYEECSRVVLRPTMQSVTLRASEQYSSLYRKPEKVFFISFAFY